jgi:hypothetical protein
MTTVKRILTAVLVYLTLAGTSLGGPAPFAAGAPGPTEPGPTEPNPDITPPIAWTQLGLSDRIDLLGSDQLVDTDVPVPAGVRPGQVRGTIGSVVDVVEGRVDVLDGRGVFLGSIPAPAEGSAPFTVDISAAQVLDGIARLSFVVRDRNPPPDSCSPPPSLTLSQLAANFLGQVPYPVTVADFLPGYVDQFLIRTGPTPSPPTQQAALELVAKLTRLYRPMPVRIDVDTSAAQLTSGLPTRRVITLRDEAPAGLRVFSPNSPDATLVITGRGGELSRQIALFADRRITLAQTSSASVSATTVDVPQSANVKTFAQLGMTGRTSVLGTATLYAGFDASQFAVGSIQEAKLHLIGHHTPVLGGEASLVVRSGDTVVAARRLGESGLIDITGTIPADAIRSNVVLALELRYLPSQPCAPLSDRIQFSLDPASTVAVTPGTHNRGGFPVLPMAFTPDFDVVVDQPANLHFAAEAINLMAQQSAVTLQPRLTDMATGIASGQGLLVVAAGEGLAQAGLTPTVSIGTTVTIGGTPTTDIDLNGPIGVIQVFSQQGRKVLAINGTGDWSLVERSFDYIRAQPARWASLSGDVVATGTAGQTATLTLREGGALLNNYPGDAWKWWALITAGVCTAIVLSTMGVLAWRRRRARHE